MSNEGKVKMFTISGIKQKEQCRSVAAINTFFKHLALAILAL